MCKHRQSRAYAMFLKTKQKQNLRHNRKESTRPSVRGSLCARAWARPSLGAHICLPAGWRSLCERVGAHPCTPCGNVERLFLSGWREACVKSSSWSVLESSFHVLGHWCSHGTISGLIHTGKVSIGSLQGRHLSYHHYYSRLSAPWWSRAIFIPKKFTSCFMLILYFVFSKCSAKFSLLFHPLFFK